MRMEVRRPPSPIRYPFAQKASPFTTFPHTGLCVCVATDCALGIVRERDCERDPEQQNTEQGARDHRDQGDGDSLYSFLTINTLMHEWI